MVDTAMFQDMDGIVDQRYFGMYSAIYSDDFMTHDFFICILRSMDILPLRVTRLSYLYREMTERENSVELSVYDVCNSLRD